MWAACPAGCLRCGIDAEQDSSFNRKLNISTGATGRPHGEYREYLFLRFVRHLQDECESTFRDLRFLTLDVL
jgi:hypothetical protein